MCQLSCVYLGEMEAATKPALALPEAIDSELNKALHRNGSLADQPLAIRRFTARTGAGRPHEAMKLATASVLMAYDNAHSGVTEPISVERLCLLSNVALSGFRPSPRSSSNISAAPQNGPTGFLEFAGAQPIIRIPPYVEFERARVAVAHELAHVLIHKKADGYDEATIRLQSSPTEEALAEYGARLR